MRSLRHQGYAKILSHRNIYRVDWRQCHACRSTEKAKEQISFFQHIKATLNPADLLTRALDATPIWMNADRLGFTSEGKRR